MSNVIHILTGRPLDPDAVRTPGPRECLACYVHRMVEAEGCSDELRWVELWRRLRAKRATALSRRLVRRGGMCDCAVVNLVWMPVMDLWSSGWEAGEPSAPTVLPTCLGVRTNSTQACEHWTAAEDVAL